MRTPRAVAIFVRREERFLVLRRSPELYWHVAAGVVEDGETFAEAAARELREETSLATTLRDVGHPLAYAVPQDMRKMYPADTREVIVHSFVADAASGWEPTLNEEHDQHRWCTREEALELLHWPEAREALRIIAPAERRVS